MNKIKKAVCLLLVFSLTIGFFPYTVKAENSEESLEEYITYDDDTKRVSQTEDDEYIYISTFNKHTKEVNLEVVNKETKMKVDPSKTYEESPKIDYSEENILRAKELVESKKSLITPLAATSVVRSQNTFVNYEYTLYSGYPRKWNLRRPNGANIITKWYNKNVTEFNSNEININLFAAEVDKINKTEWRIVSNILQLFVSVVEVSKAIASGGVLALPAVKAIMSSIGGVATTAQYAYELVQQCSKAYKLYHAIS